MRVWVRACVPIPNPSSGGARSELRRYVPQRTRTEHSTGGTENMADAVSEWNCSGLSIAGRRPFSLLSGRRGGWSWKAVPSAMGLAGRDWTAQGRGHTEVVLRGQLGPVRARDEIEVRST